MDCPQCQARIDCLVNYRTEDARYIFRVRDGEPDYQEIGRDIHTSEYVCPQCLATLAEDEDEAKGLLGGKG